MIGVLKILAQVLGALAFALLVPAAIALAGEEGVAENFLVVAGLAGFVSGAMYFALRGYGHGLNRVARFVLAVSLWVVVPVVAAVPIALSTGIGYAPALFEATSGFTTTGASVFSTLSDVGPAVIFWRAELQWLGGLATLVMFVAILAPAEVGGLSSRGLALVGGFGDARPGRTRHLMREVAAIYATLTAICILLLFAVGVPLFAAICVAFSTVSTGGFMPNDGTIADYGSRFATFVTSVFMLIGGTSLIWQRMVLERRGTLMAEHRETYWVVGAMILAGIIYAAQFAGSEGIFSALGEGLFSGISLVSTTGFETRRAGLAALPDALVVLLALGGGASLSTAGGVKYYRIGAMLVQSTHELQRLIFPHVVRSTRFGSQTYDLALMKAIWTNFGLALAVIVVAMLLLSLSLPSFDAAFVAAVAAFSGIGPLYSPEWAIGSNWPHYADFNALSQIVMIVTMILGRVEVVVFFAAISLSYWRS